MLPFQKQVASRKNPKRLIIYGKPKVGKTTAVSLLEDTLILDLEGGTDHVDAMRMRVIGLTAPREKPETKTARHEEGNFYLNEVAHFIREHRKENGSYPYKRVVVDTLTQLEAWCEDHATLKYMQSAQGKSFNRDEAGRPKPRNQWESVLTLPMGSGYFWLRQSMTDWLAIIDDMAPDIIQICHLKDKLINKAGKEMSSKDIDLTGKIAKITAASSDAIAYIYRKKNETILNFASTDDTCGSSCSHLKGKEIVLMEEDKEGKVTASH